jgi:dTDP-4-amino-4,6-dideoxygalactose transaminase
MGPETAALERAFADYTGVAEAVAVTNGTAALHLATSALGLGVGDEVMVPSLTFVATVNAIEYTGARPRLCRYKRAGFAMAVGGLLRGADQRAYRGDRADGLWADIPAKSSKLRL